MPFLTDNELKQAVADALKLQNVASLPAVWDTPITDGNAMAYADILAALLDRGFTQAQIDGWGSGKAIQKMQGMYWTFSLAGSLHSFDDRWVNKWDQRANLKVIPVQQPGGDAQSPAGEPGLVEVGTFDVLDDPGQMVNGRLLHTTQDRWAEKNFPM